MRCIGITGGIGSGKTSISRAFQTLGVPVYNSDVRAKLVMVENTALKSAIIDHFGSESYSGKELNRTFLAQQVFKDKSQLEKLNSLVHPAVFKDYDQWKQEQNFDYHLREAAILFESGSHKNCDEVILIVVPEEERIKRVMKRDGLTTKQVKERISKQWSDEEKMKLADHVWKNDNKEHLLEKVLTFHKAQLKA
jgi:dephospho-CoA kinase